MPSSRWQRRLATLAGRMDDRPRTRPYARIERERRFALDALPEAVDPGDYERLRDTYVAGADLRLRRIEAPDGTFVQLKLGQKKADPDAPDDPRRREMTTFYLREDEGRVLGTLPGARSVKRRYRLREQGRTFCIDVYEQPTAAAGTMVAEVECDTDDELDAIAMPAWATREVTTDERFSGARLARSRA